MQQNNSQGNPSIHCTVNSCKHNNQSKTLCKLNAISVCPVSGKSTTQPDESMCKSYEH